MRANPNIEFIIIAAESQIVLVCASFRVFFLVLARDSKHVSRSILEVLPCSRESLLVYCTEVPCLC